MVIRKIISRYLEALKCPHHLCVDGAQAWEWFQKNHGSCPGVITDLEMPLMGGNALIGHVQSLCPGKPCFIVSGNDLSHNQLPPGTIRAIVKPIVSEQLQQIVTEISDLNNGVEPPPCPYPNLCPYRDQGDTWCPESDVESIDAQIWPCYDQQKHSHYSSRTKNGTFMQWNPRVSIILCSWSMTRFSPHIQCYICSYIINII